MTVIGREDDIFEENVADKAVLNVASRLAVSDDMYVRVTVLEEDGVSADCDMDKVLEVEDKTVAVGGLVRDREMDIE